ncbi:hypothetical protein Dimus_011434 [Dionaea muscipula]
MDGGTTAAAALSSSASFIDTVKSERIVYLMKTPPVVSRCLQPSDDSSHPVAKVTLSIDPLSSNNEDRQFTMELTSSELGNVPKCYSMDMSKDLLPMSVFSESAQGNFSVEGKIMHKFDMKPQYEAIDSYGKLCRERSVKFNTRSRQTQMIGNDRGTHMLPMPGGMIMTMEKKKVPVKVSETKRSRRDRGEMEGIMFKLFERQPNWTLRQLIQETDQPEQFLKDILKDLCVYNNKGANQGTYELKLEYRGSS